MQTFKRNGGAARADDQSGWLHGMVCPGVSAAAGTVSLTGAAGHGQAPRQDREHRGRP